MRKLVMAGILAVLLGVGSISLLIAAAYLLPEAGTLEVSMGQSGIRDSIVYTGIACPTVTRASGRVEDIPCSHNLITYRGKELIQWNMEGNGTQTVLDKLALGNSSAGQLATDTNLASQYTTCGLTVATGTLASVGIGNWSITKQFTSTCNNVVVNTTGIYNTTTTGNLFAQANFTSVTLNINDQLTIIYYTGVT